MSTESTNRWDVPPLPTCAHEPPDWKAMWPQEREQYVLALIYRSEKAVKLNTEQGNTAWDAMQAGAPIVYQSTADDHWGIGWHIRDDAPLASHRPQTSQTQIVVAKPVDPPAPVEVRQAVSDVQLVTLWLHGRSEATTRAYRSDAAKLLDKTGKPLAEITLGDLQSFADGLTGAEASRIRNICAVKSLFAFAKRLGYLPFDVGAALKIPKKKDQIAERILTEGQMHQLLAAKVCSRDHAMLLLLYSAGIRISELCGLSWKDASTREDGDGLLTVYGKGGKTRFVRVPESAWVKVIALRGQAGPEDPIFTTTHGRIDETSAHRAVKNAAKLAGLDPKISAHWLRHAHASHALDRGAPVSLVQATLGHASLATTGRYLHAKPKESSGKYLGL